MRYLNFDNNGCPACAFRWGAGVSLVQAALLMAACSGSVAHRARQNDEQAKRALCSQEDLEQTPENVRLCNEREQQIDRDWGDSAPSLFFGQKDEDGLGRGAEGPGSKPSEEPLTAAGVFLRSRDSIVTVEAGNKQGTGFVVHSGGLVVTNVHVVAGAKSATVVAGDGTRIPVESVYAYDLKRDLAVLRIRHKLPSLALASGDLLVPGQQIVAIGNPLGLEASISEGVVSGVRQLKVGPRVIQISAAISPGSSGGPILDQWGSVVGVATFKLRGGENLAFGMPVEYVRRALEKPTRSSLERFAQLTRESEPAETEGETLDPKVLAGCGDADLVELDTALGHKLDAIVPLTQAGDPSVLATFLAGTAAECERRLSPACKEPKALLQRASSAAFQAKTEAERVAQLASALRGLKRAASRERGLRTPQPATTASTQSG